MANWDIIIIGAGPSGLTAAATAASAGLSCLIIDRMGGGGELMNLGPLHDVDGALTGPDLAARLLEEATTAGAELAVAEVAAISPDAIHWRVSTDSESHTARAIILATGLAHGTLGLPNEAEFEGRGLSHCAACDGPLCRGQPVVVAGASRWAQQEARDLAAIASHVTLITQGATVPPIENVTIIPGRIAGLEGVSGLEAVLVQPDDGAVRRVPADSVFVQTGRRPVMDFAPASLARDSDGAPLTGETLQTNLPTIFAAGDARAGSAQTLGAAMADGRRAAAAAHAALNPT